MEKENNNIVHEEKKKKIVGAEGKPLKQKQTHPYEEYFWKGGIVFLIVAACIIFAVVVVRIEAVLNGIHSLLGIFEPILCGLVFAYLLNPVMNRFEKIFTSLLEKKGKDKDKLHGMVRGLSIFITLVLAILVVAILLYMILPELFETVSNMVKDLPEQFSKFTNWVTSLSINERLDGVLAETLSSIGSYVENWAKDNLITKMDSLFSTVTVGVVGFINIIEDIFIGIIVSVYVLSNKERFIGQGKKLIYALFQTKTANTTLELLRDSNQIFTGFLTGKVIDSFIIGIICFVCLSILQMPYTLLVSVIVGITNIVPFFGPYIGGAISVVLILLSDPKAGVVFVIFIIILQQIDGNLIGPKILGESTGLSAFWVIFSILVGSGLFGFIGMIFGVPTFAVIYHLLKKFVEKRLEKKKLPVETEAYHDLHYIQKTKVVLREKNRED
ncbi:MAG: AI-2E family transporter [Lachnospiraceae bacterium]|nr:AI-2E family transporter [Lachnospiraceae bacterium]